MRLHSLRPVMENRKAIRENENPVHGCAARCFQSTKVLCRITTGRALEHRAPQGHVALHVLLPPGLPSEVSRAPDPAGLEEASGVRFLESNGEAGVPSPEEQNRPPRPQESQLRRTLARRLRCAPEEVQCFRAPTAKGLDRERHEAAAR